MFKNFLHTVNINQFKPFFFLKVHNVHHFYPIKRKQVEKARRCPQLIPNTSCTTEAHNNVEVENKLKQVSLLGTQICEFCEIFSIQICYNIPRYICGKNGLKILNSYVTVTMCKIYACVRTISTLWYLLTGSRFINLF